MPLNDRKVIRILMEECQKIEERCPGYRDEVLRVLADIMLAERQHRVQATNIQQKVSDKCGALGVFLSEATRKPKKR